MAFIPLHIYSGFSYLQSGLSVKKIAYLAKKKGYSALGICDNASLSGYAPFTHLLLEEGIKPLYGMDVLLEEGNFSCFVLNEEGYLNLCHLALLASENNLSLAALKTNCRGLRIIYTPPLDQFLARYDASSKELARYYHELFKGLNDVLLGLLYLFNDSITASKLRSFAEAYSYDLIAFPKILYEKKEDAIVLEIVKAIANKDNLSTKEKVGSEYFLSSNEVENFYTQKEIALTEKLLEESDFTLIKKRGGLLEYPCPNGEKSSSYLRSLAYEGLRKKIGSIPEEYQKRLDYELSVIEKMGYPNYFLIVSDYVNYAKENGISVGPGRGSGAGSLVSYALGIVEVDPIKYGLLFERFLNPGRQSMPDIDVDFADVSRDRVAMYLQEKYGKDRVGHVLTTQTIGAKEAIRDIGRVYKYPQSHIELLIKTIMNEKLSLRDDYRTSPRFKELVDKEPYYLEFVRLASKIEGLPRQAGIHAAGMVVNDKPLSEVLPVSDNEGTGYVACLEKDYLEEQGFLKMDILGLTNLTTIDECLALINENQKISLTYKDIPVNDEEAIKLIRSGKTMGLFQLESPGMKRALRQIEPSSLLEVASLLALFRPGPMDSIPSFAARKKGKEKIAYLSPELEPILKETYGIIVYQEQITQIVRAMAGFDYGEADLFRRAISKKKIDKLAALKEDFILGAIKKGHGKQVAEEVFALILRFANYGFNKAHAVSYAFITCQMAYLKAHYPKEFYCAILNAMGTGEGKFKNTLSEMKSLNLHLSLPDINLSARYYLIKEDKILFPLSQIKTLPDRMISQIIDERNAKGPFKDFFDFVGRSKCAGLNLASLIRLIDSGALDSLNSSRASLRAAASSALQYADMVYAQDGSPLLLASSLEKPVIPSIEDSIQENLALEYEALGLMLSGSPLSIYRKQLAKDHVLSLDKIKECRGGYVGAAIVKSCRKITTKKGKEMAFVEFYDELSEQEFTIFPSTYEVCFPFLKNDALVLFKGHKDESRENTYIIDELEALGEHYA